MTLGMDKIWMPFLEQSCNIVAGRWGGGLGPDSRTVLEVGVNKRQNLTGSRLEEPEPIYT